MGSSGNTLSYTQLLWLDTYMYLQVSCQDIENGSKKIRLSFGGKVYILYTHRQPQQSIHYMCGLCLYRNRYSVFFCVFITSTLLGYFNRSCSNNKTRFYHIESCCAPGSLCFSSSCYPGTTYLPHQPPTTSHHHHITPSSLSH